MRHLSKNLAEATVASTNDIVHIDKGTGFISFIGGSNKTSHHRELGEDQTADRLMYSHHLTDDGAVVPLSQRLQVRVPSLAVKALHEITEILLDEDEKQKKKPAIAEPLINKEIEERIKALDPKQKLMSSEIGQIKHEYEQMAKLLKDNPNSRQAAFNALMIDDAAEKLVYLQKKYQLGEEPGVSELPKAFVYNLYTSLNKTSNVFELFDESRNKQRQSAEHLLAAAHAYNRNDSKGPLCLIQNIGVNGWGYELSIKDNNSELVNEAALMTQMASLHTVYDIMNQPTKKMVEQLFRVYTLFLDDKDEKSFYKYLKNKNPDALNLLQAIKIDMQNKENNELIVILIGKYADPKQAPEDVQALFVAKSKYDDNQEGTQDFYSYLKKFNPDVLRSLYAIKDRECSSTETVQGVADHSQAFAMSAKKALATLFKDESFGKHENGYTYQALSVFVEKASLSGCKSGNERAQAVNGRASILDFVSLDKKTRDALLQKYLSENEAKHLIVLADSLERTIAVGNAAQMTQQLDFLYESLNLEGFQAVISFVDQGGHAKLGTNNGVPDTNNGETVTTDVEHAAKWQCHKGLTDNVLKEFRGIQEIDFEKELKNVLKVVAATVGATGVALGIAAIIGITAAFPPAGLLIGLAAASALVAYTFIKIIPQLWKSREAATQSRFAAIQCKSACKNDPLLG